MFAHDTVRISERWHDAVCPGLCPSYDVTVQADGLVEVRQVLGDKPRHRERYRVSPAQAARFAEHLSRYRPHGVITPVCDRAGFDDPERLREVVELEITWDGRDRLNACHGREVSEAIGQALLEVGLDPAARRVSQ